MTYTLFVSADRRRRDLLCPGSTLCTEFLEDVPPGAVDVVDCDARDFVRPPWLEGTPTLLDDVARKRWTGHEAVRRLYHMALHRASTAAAPSKTTHVAPAPTASARRTEEAETEDDLDSAWQSRIVEEEQEEDRADRKLTGDDLGRLMQTQRTPSANPDPAKAPPPPAPLKD